MECSFTAPDLSSNGGLLLLREIESKYGFLSKFTSLINEWRNENLLVHDLLTDKEVSFTKSSGFGNVSGFQVAVKPGASGNVVVGVKNPMVFYATGRAWTEGNIYNPISVNKDIVWQDPKVTPGSSGKSIFDPSPPGWKVPEASVWEQFQTTPELRPCWDTNTNDKITNGFYSFYAYGYLNGGDGTFKNNTNNRSTGMSIRCVPAW